MKYVMTLLPLLMLPMVGWSQVSIETTKASTIQTMTEGCLSSILEPDLNRFMEKAKAAGKPFADEQSARKAIEQSRREMEKTDFFKNELKPAVVATCRCGLENTIEKINKAKSQTQIDAIIRDTKPDRELLGLCTQKHMRSVQKR